MRLQTLESRRLLKLVLRAEVTTTQQRLDRLPGRAVGSGMPERDTADDPSAQG